MERLLTDALHVDAHVIVAIKPTGLLAVPGRGADKQDCLSSRLAEQFGDIHIVHRLDQATSGLMVFARDLSSLRHLHEQFRQGHVTKTYQAVLHGRPPQQRFTIDLPLAADWPNRPKQKIDYERGKPSITHVDVQSYDQASDTSRVHLTPITGRTHQLRVHLQAVGHPIVGDPLYGESFLKAPQALLNMACRLMLHASFLAFEHPVTGEPLAFESGFEI